MRIVSARREERLCSLSFPESTTFFRFAKSFSRRPSVVFSRREERLCSLLLSKSTTFFRFVKLCFTVEPVVFFNREERLCSSSLRESTLFFVSAKFDFACVSVNRFPSSRGAFMLHPAPLVKHYFALWLNRLSQCVIPVTREKQSKRTHSQCQPKNQKTPISSSKATPATAMGTTSPSPLQ